MKAEAEGFQPDAIVMSDEVPEGRPKPYMIYLNALRLQVQPMEAIIKVLYSGKNFGWHSHFISNVTNLVSL